MRTVMLPSKKYREYLIESVIVALPEKTGSGYCSMDNILRLTMEMIYQTCETQVLAPMGQYQHESFEPLNEN
jgi:hypothetical protein